MKVAILQSNYLPWLGYFDIISSVDLFIFYDDLQYTKNDWRNRNKIKGPCGLQWITIPTGQNLKRLICEVEIKNKVWQQKHWKSLKNCYAKSPFFSYPVFNLYPIFPSRNDPLLSIDRYLSFKLEILVVMFNKSFFVGRFEI